MNDNLIHVKLEYEEGLQAKRDILTSEMDLIRIIKHIQRYNFLRNNEVKQKLKLKNKIRETLITIRKIQKIIPKLETQSKFRIEKEKDDFKRLEEIGKQYDQNLEIQLKDIQEKLNRLQK
ncbi:MAG: hypothetical protein KKA64_00535 [Nanoarchaeota archaeon]|nr:hypothetical protein [Nanoarchaeota archaeon]